MMDPPVQVNIDGAARGNPGPAAFAYVIRRGNQLVEEDAGRLGTTTNNFAEYTALVRALHRAAELGEKRLLIWSDSELLVKQMNGEYRVKSADLQPLYQKAKELQQHFDSVVIRHVRREQNTHADRLCNEALDGLRGERDQRTVTAPSRAHPARLRALECLRSAAAEWSKGNDQVPSVEQVWDQLVNILREHGLLVAAAGKKRE
jgi:ribonuclease HI